MGFEIHIMEVFDLVGTVAFAMLGTWLGIAKRLDIFGVLILALLTAVGGGVLRDVVIANTPPLAFRNPLYVEVSIASAFFAMLTRRYMERVGGVVQVCDAIGLGAFAATGADIAALSGHYSLLTAAFLAVVTAVGGGVLRDLSVCEVPGVLYKEIYATAALAGAAAYYFARPHLGGGAMYLCFAVTTGLRLFALRRHWALPTVK